MVTPLREGDVAVHGMAPWAKRRGRLVQLLLLGGGAVMASAILATLSGTDSFAVGVGLALATAALAVGLAWYVRRLMPRVRLEVRDDGVTYEAGSHRIEAAWADVAAVDLVLRGSDTGPALVLRGDRAVSGGGMLAMADLGGALGGTAIAAPSLRSTIPLAAFVEGRFRGSAVERDLRRHIPDLVDDYLERYPGRDR